MELWLFEPLIIVLKVFRLITMFRMHVIKRFHRIHPIYPIFLYQCCPKRFSIKPKKGSKAKVERTTLAMSTISFTSYGKYNTFRTSNLPETRAQNVLIDEIIELTGEHLCALKP